jgi:rubredoxin
VSDEFKYCNQNDYVSRETLYIEFRRHFTVPKGWRKLAKFVIDAIPPADVAPVELAHWIQANDIDETAWRCSKCDLTWILNEGTPSQNEMRYCPKCGAYMIESEVNNNGIC